MIIGVTGTLASGKDTIAEFLSKRGFYHLSLSAILRELLKKEGRKITVANLTEFGNSMRKKYGSGFLAEEALKKAGEHKNLIISSIRQPGEVELLRKQSSFYLIAVDAPVEIRFSRLKKRGRSDDPKTLEEFIKIEKKQMGGQGKDINLTETMKTADVKIINDGAIGDFYAEIEKIFKKIKTAKLG